MIVLAVAIGLYIRSQDDPVEKRGSATEEFVTTEEPEPKPPPKKDDPRPWPTYGYDNERSHVSPYNHRPPYKRLWSIDAHDTRRVSADRWATAGSTSPSRRASSSR